MGILIIPTMLSFHEHRYSLYLLVRPALTLAKNGISKVSCPVVLDLYSTIYMITFTQFGTNFGQFYDWNGWPGLATKEESETYLLAPGFNPMVDVYPL